MTLYNCINCDDNIILKNNNGRDYDPSKHYLLCKQCINGTNICSKLKCNENYLLTNNDLHPLKYLYIVNPSNCKKYYLYSDIEKVIAQKYGNIDSLKKTMNEREKKLDLIKQKKLHKIDNRRNELVKALQENKLEFQNYGNSFMYINYGQSSVEDIIKEEIKKTSNKMVKRQILALALSKVNITLDESLSSVYNFINGVGYKNDIDEVVKAVEIEHFFKYNTDYNKLVKNMGIDEIVAKDIAIKRYAINQNKPKYSKNNCTTLSFD